MKLTAQDRLKFLSRAVGRAEVVLAELKTRQVAGLLRPGIPRSQLETAEEALAAAEALLLLAVEREAVWNALQATSRANAATLAPPPPIPDADES